MELEIGPTLRAARRHKGTFGLVVMQFAASFAILSSLMVIGLGLRQLTRLPPGFDVTELIGVDIQTPHAAPVAAVPPTALGSPEIVAVTRLWPSLRSDEGAPTEHRAGKHHARGWTVRADRAIAAVLGFNVIEGALPIEGGAPGAGDPVILTRSLREKLFPDGTPAVGATIASDDAPPGRVVAVIENVISREPFYPQPYDTAFRISPPFTPGLASYVVRARPGRRDAALAGLAAALGPGDPARVVTLTPFALVPPHYQDVSDGLQLVFAIIGTTVSLIALVGALAVSSFIVAARRRDVGVRRALGARRRDILRYFLVEASLMAALGLAVGLVISLGLWKIIGDVFRGLPIGARYLLPVAFLLWANALAAALVPARRASRIPPSTASRGG
jgi:putative ABC transport system permease protein